MDDPNITMEEYIRLEEEKARRPGKLYNWETATISFDESEDEDYTEIYDKSSFSYKIFFVNDLKTDSENDNDKVNMPSFSSSEPTIEPTVSPQHIDEFNLNNETSLSECDGEEQNVIYFNDLFPFNVIYPDDLKSDMDNDDDKIDIKQFSKDNVINTDVGAYAQGSNKLLETSINTAYPGNGYDDLNGKKLTTLVEYL
ncbi:hypothetical protein Tco_1070138 [Tanacetum coccineum]|uniref:Uncharacterized protein n=1 Tax=Tanacetum coccineum TaxID=301880 RepID=A0ABQ5HLZ6_9ASTR